LRDGIPPVLEPTTETVIKIADDLYRNRRRPGAVQDSISSLVSVPGFQRTYEIFWRLSRAFFFVGQSETGSAGYAAGIKAGKEATRVAGQSVEGRFWLGVNLALFAESIGGIRGALALLSARSELGRAVGIREAYHGAGPLRVLGRLEHKAPWFLGGDRKRGLGYLNRALQLAPRNTVTLLYAAELANEMGDVDRAVALLEIVLAVEPDPDWQYETVRDQTRARNMLARVNRRDCVAR
jgi:hypothetical protein